MVAESIVDVIFTSTLFAFLIEVSSSGEVTAILTESTALFSPFETPKPI